MTRYSPGFLVEITDGEFKQIQGRVTHVGEDFCNILIARTKATKTAWYCASVNFQFLTLIDSSSPPERKFMGDYVNEFIERIYYEFRNYTPPMSKNHLLTLGKIYGIITKAKARRWQHKREWQLQFWNLYTEIFSPPRKPIKSATKLG